MVLFDTISAIATPLGAPGGIGIVRISGKNSLRIIKRIFKPTSKDEFISHRIRHGWIVDNSKAIDEVMVSYMASPNSYTGEDVVEISCHGGPSVLKMVLELTVREGARLAQRGEFTKRAFLNGKIDLSQAEAIIDLIKARTKESSIMAASHLKGSLSFKIKGLRQLLMDLIAGIEASIDFPDEIDDIDRQKVITAVDTAIKAVDNLLITADFGVIYREGVSVAIIGKPNVGKSSLLNALLRQERAIVAEEPGTTRDIIEETVNIKGIPFKVVDTAGIRRPNGNVEKLGIDRARKALENAELAILVIDISDKLANEDNELIESTEGSKKIVALNKADKNHLLKATDIKRLAECQVIEISALKGEGIERLEEAMLNAVIANKVVAQNIDVMINLRQKQCLQRARELLEKSRESIEKKMQADFISIDLKGAIAAMGEVTGEIVSDEVIDRIFEQFCVGK